jgi:putative Holliday junction resolvase
MEKSMSTCYAGSMRYMGIDYGTKRVGIAISDSENKFAIPHSVIENSKKLLENLNDLLCQNDVDVVIMGESKNFKGEENAVMKEIKEFKDKIENNLQKKVIFEPEFLTSHQAEYFQGKTALLDASAAAIILQSYLDKLQQK